MTRPFPSAGWLVAARAASELLGAFVSPLRLTMHVLFGRSEEKRRLDRALAAEAPPPPPANPPPPEPAPGPPLTIFVASGEASGEGHVVNLVKALRSRRANLRFVGFGGDLLRAEGVDVVETMGTRAGMGLVHGVKSIPRHAAIAKRFVECLDRERPAVCVFMDNPGFHLVLASLAKSRATPAIQYVCPQVWAWAPWRWRRIQRDLTSLLAILPFEAGYFAERGIPVDYVGHPLGDVPLEKASIPEPAPARPIVLFAGSRAAEVRRHAPTLARVARELASRNPSLRFVMTFRNPALADLARSIVSTSDLVSTSDHVEIVHGPPDPWLAGAPLAIVKSGTGTLEIARHGIPIVVLYRIAKEFDRKLSRWLLSVPHISILNLLARREIVPEILYVREDEEVKITDAAWTLLTNGRSRQAQLAAVDGLRPYFDTPGASARAAEAILRHAGASRG